MNILVINGPNINMLGQRQTEIYGTKTYHDLKVMLKAYAKVNKIRIKIFQSNHEGKIIDYIQNNHHKYQGLIINPGAFTHYSYAIRDALAMTSLKKIEVHISNIFQREDFRKVSLIKDLVDKTITGKGLDGYIEAMDFLLKGDSR